MRRFVLFVICLVPALGLVAAPISSAGTDASPPDAGLADSLGQQPLDPQTVVMGFHVRADGTAVARVEYRMRLDDGNSTATFEQFRRDVTANRSTYTNRFTRRVRATAATAENATGRDMAVENVTVRATIEQLPKQYGVVAYSFEWHGFAATEGDRLVVGDALGGLYLDNDTQLLVSWPEGYEAQSVGSDVHEHRDAAAVWVGPRYFGPGGPTVVLTTAGGATGFGNVAVLAVGGVGVLALGGGAVWWWRSTRGVGRAGGPVHPDGSATPGESRDGSPESEATPAEPSAAGGSTTESSAASESGADAPTAATDAPEPATSTDAGDETPDGEADPSSGDADSGLVAPDDPELLSNEERVLRLLEREGGRIKQQAVVEEFDWSAPKASRVVGTLREEGRIESFRLGNENVLSLPTDEEDSR